MTSLRPHYGTRVRRADANAAMRMGLQSAHRWHTSCNTIGRIPMGSCPTAISQLNGALTNVSMRRRRNRLVAFIAAFLLIAGLGAYSAHGSADRTHDHGHCDLCAHFSGSAGSPPPAAVVGKPVLAIRVPLTRPEPIRAERRRVATHLPRGPPLAS